jgi:hypothetical protein
MADDAKPPRHHEHQISIQLAPLQSNGVYSHLLMITHRKEEFVLDFLFVQPQRSPQGQSIANLRSRVITSPEHAKRFLKALTENVRRYEDSFGVIEEAQDMPKVMH